MQRQHSVTVRIRHGDFEVVFEGDKDVVWESVNRYFAERLGPVDLMMRLMGDTSVTEAAEKLVGKVVINRESVDVLVSGDSKKRILACLAGAWLGKRLGLVSDDGLSPKKVASFLRMDERAARARLSELWRDGTVDKDDEGRYFFKPSKGWHFLED
ncbi:MAG: hypothetical protein NZ956_02480 [Candidatus Caldarchaeum sp.]|nr:hypothetical protein [Candidatus Caldarchaeum sp.]